MKTLAGRIVESTGSWYEVAVEDQSSKTMQVIKARLPGRFRLDDREVTNPVAVGDFVRISMNEDGTASIEEIEERENYITREATHGRRGEQILAANIDQAMVVQSVRKPKIKEGFIDRFLVTCEAYQIPPFIIINKMDLAKDKEKEYVGELVELYRSLGYQILLTSINDPESIDLLKEELKNKTSVFIGPSGVGKTSLLNQIDPEINRKVSEVSDYSNKGTHTTTYAKLVALNFGGYLVDTPGIREYGLVNIEPWELSLFFPEMLESRQDCKFNNCTHSHEPKCGVIKAFEDGDIDAGRYHSYLQMLESLKNN